LPGLFLSATFDTFKRRLKFCFILTQYVDKHAFKFTFKLVQENDLAAMVDQQAMRAGIAGLE